MMIKSFIDKFRPALTYDELMAISTNSMKDLIGEKDASMEYLKLAVEKARESFEGFEKEWKDYHSDDLRNASSATNRHAQILLIRKIALNGLERSIDASMYFKRNDIERSILAQALDKTMTFNDFDSAKAMSRLYGELSCYCFRSISLLLGDVRHNDWFDTYAHLYSKLVEILYSTIIAEKNNEDYSLSVFLGTTKSTIDDFKSRILRGEKVELTDDEIAAVASLL